MAKYMILIYGDAEQWDAMTAEQWDAHNAGHGAFVGKAGARVLDGRQLETAPTATSLRADAHGQVHVTDGPFLETKEGLGGYYLVEAADLDEVLELARLLPELNYTHSGLEIRPVVERE
ncbi:YciI family protein [Lentzea sp.]|uniref:YciI family protein n=1 Tax=Lentzea sp. TaxID=56099 RepID=UPI002ED139BB